ncbi:MAG: diguanylate cyclase [Deltaproteobacteria bacterium]|nr:diguanylate cyclase [Deltaproteobacteria bacterium]
MRQPSEVLRRILGAVRDTEISTRELGMMLQSEPGLVERLFRYIDLYYRWIGSEQRDPVRATTLLGPKVVGPIVIQHMLVGAIEVEAFPSRVLLAYWSTAVWRAIGARLLAAQLAETQQDEAFSLGFGLEYGALPLMERSGQYLRWAREVNAAVGEERKEREVQLFRESHEKSMVRTGQAWALPKDYLYMIAVHGGTVDQVPKDKRELWAAVRWADRLSQAMSSSAAGVHLERWVDEVTLELGLGRNDAWAIVEVCLTQATKVAEMLGVEVIEQPSLDLLRGRDGATPETMDREGLLDLVHLLEEDNQRLVVARDAALQEALDLRSTDAVTRLPTHEAFVRTLARDVQAAQRGGKPLVLMLVDVDDFVAVNAHAGFEAGDKVLVRVGEILTKALRQRDRVARMGPDEFAVLLNTDERGGHLVAERIRAGVEAARIDAGDERLRVTVRIVGGPLLADFRDALHWHSFLSKTLRKSKERAGNRVYWVNAVS